MKCAEVFFSGTDLLTPASKPIKIAVVDHRSKKVGHLEFTILGQNNLGANIKCFANVAD